VRVETRTITIDEIKNSVAGIAERYGIKRAVLFGSYASGSQTESSDIDILVEFLTTATATLLTIAGIKIALEERIGKNIDVIAEPIPAGSLLQIKDEVVLYE